VTQALLVAGASVRVLVRHRSGRPTSRRTSSGRRATCTNRTTCSVPSPMSGPPSTSARVRLVFAGVHVHDRNPVKQVMYRLLFRLWLRHYQGKLAVAKAIERSDTNPVLLIPSNFMQNDDVFLDDIAAGEFCQPLAGVNRVDLRDVAQVASDALLDDEFRSGAYSLVGPESLSGEQCATVWQRELGREVRCTGATRAPGRRRSRATSRVGSSSTGRPRSGP